MQEVIIMMTFKNAIGYVRVSTERQADEGDFAFRPAGYGIQDFPSILEAAKKAGSEWLVVEQDRTCLGWDSLDCIKKAVDYLKTINK